MRYAFDDAGAAERHETQYFEMFCNRGIYHEGWTAVTRHSTPWVIGASCRRSPTTPGSSTTPTPTGARRTTSRPRCPRSSTSCKALFMEEARKYNVLPLDDRRVERFNSDLAGRPTLITRQLAAALRRHGPADARTSVLNIKNKSHSVTAELTVPDGGAEGVIVAQGGAFAGWSLYVKDGRPKYCYNLFGIRRFNVEGDSGDPGRHAPGAHGVRLRRRRPRQGRHRLALRRRRRRPARAASRRPCRWSSRPTRPATSAPTPPRPSATTTRRRAAASPARRLGADRHRRRGRGPRPPDHAGGAPQDRDGAAVGAPEDRRVRLARAGRADRRRIDQPRPRRRRRALPRAGGDGCRDELRPLPRRQGREPGGRGREARRARAHGRRRRRRPACRRGAGRAREAGVELE